MRSRPSQKSSICAVPASRTRGHGPVAQPLRGRTSRRRSGGRAAQAAHERADHIAVHAGGVQRPGVLPDAIEGDGAARRERATAERGADPIAAHGAAIAGEAARRSSRRGPRRPQIAAVERALEARIAHRPGDRRGGFEGAAHVGQRLDLREVAERVGIGDAQPQRSSEGAVGAMRTSAFPTLPLPCATSTTALPPPSA
jgi:hypothetical protein